MEGILKLSLVQPDIEWENIDANLARYDELLTYLQGGTNIVILPELFSTGFTMEVGKMAERMEGKTFRWMRDTASRYKVSITGSFICTENNNFYNRLIWISPKGEYFHYDKRHLFRMGQENLYYTPGNKKLIINYKNWRICPLICYDLRFPVWSRNTDAYDLLIYIANWPAARSQAWNILNRARAIENQCFVAAVNRIGKDGHGIEYDGESMVIDPKGIPKNEIYRNKQQIISCEIDINELIDFRQKFPVSEDADEFTIDF